MTLEQCLYALYLFAFNKQTFFRNHVIRYLGYLYEHKLVSRIAKMTNMDDITTLSKNNINLGLKY